MKAVKIILSFITLLSLTFFATGLLIKEVKYKAKAVIYKPIEVVFKEFNETENFKKWIPEIKEIKIIKSKPEKIGSEYLLTVQNKGFETQVQQKIISFVKNQKITLESSMKDMKKIDDYILTKKDDSLTIVECKANYRSESYILGCVLPYFKKKFKEQDQKHLDNLKRILEKKTE